MGGIRLVVAADVDNPLLGLRGATNVYGPQKGALPSDLPALDGALGHVRRARRRQGAGRRCPAPARPAGSATRCCCSARERVAGIATVLELTGFAREIACAGLVVTGEGAFDWQSLRGKVVHGVASACEPYGVPCIVLAGRVDVGRREMNANGIESAYAMVDLPGGVDAAMGRSGVDARRAGRAGGADLVTGSLTVRCAESGRKPVRRWVPGNGRPGCTECSTAPGRSSADRHRPARRDTDMTAGTTETSRAPRPPRLC